MPITLHRYFGDDYYECPTRQLAINDEVIYKSWVTGLSERKSSYVIRGIDLNGGTISAVDTIWHPDSVITWSIADNFGETGWLRKVTEQPYDPTQMGDKEDDI